MNKELNQAVADAIRKFCADREILHYHLANALKISESGICVKLNGKHRITIDEYIMICDALGVSYLEFLPERKVKEDKRWKDLVRTRKPHNWAERIAAGVCARCGQPKEDAGKNECRRCRAGKAEYNRTHPRKDNKELRREKANANRAKGLCACGKPVTPGYKTCEICRPHKRIAQPEERVQTVAQPALVTKPAVKPIAKPEPAEKPKAVQRKKHNNGDLNNHPDVIQVCVNCEKDACNGMCKEVRAKMAEIMERRRRARERRKQCDQDDG